MDPITSQLTANPMAMANPTGGMQQMPVGPMPQTPAVPTGFPQGRFGGVSPTPPMQQNPAIQGALSQFRPMAQDIISRARGLFGQIPTNPIAQDLMTQYQDSPMYQRMMQPMSQMGQQGQMPQLPQFDQYTQQLMDFFQRMTPGRRPDLFAPRGRFGHFGGPSPSYEREDQYGNPVARPVMYDYQSRMPDLMQRYGMM